MSWRIERKRVHTKDLFQVILILILILIQILILILILSVICSFIGYQARGAAPSNFDVTYAYNAGFVATSLVLGGFNGYCATINNLKDHVSTWRPLGIPVTAMMSIVNGKATIPKAFVDLNGPAYRQLALQRENHIVNDSYTNPGPLQYMGPTELVDSVPMTLQLGIIIVIIIVVIIIIIIIIRNVRIHGKCKSITKSTYQNRRGMPSRLLTKKYSNCY